MQGRHTCDDKRVAVSLQEPFLRKLLELHGFALEMNRKDFLALNWAPFLERAATMTPQYRWLQSMHEPCSLLLLGAQSSRPPLKQGLHCEQSSDLIALQTSARLAVGKAGQGSCCRGKVPFDLDNA